MKIIISILFLLLLNLTLKSQDTSYSKPRSYSEYYYISNNHFSLFCGFINDLRNGRPQLYRDTFISLIDSILSVSSISANIQNNSVDKFFLLKIRNKLTDGKKISLSDKIHFLRFIFNQFTIKTDVDIWERSCNLTDEFLDTSARLQKYDSTFFLSKYINSERKLGKFKKVYPKTSIFYLSNSYNKILVNNTDFINDSFPLLYNKEVIKLLELMVKALNDNQVLIKVNTYYP
ncbi:MAG: hypothetical protein V4613_13265 [Bacteroidota bacterium]